MNPRRLKYRALAVALVVSSRLRKVSMTLGAFIVGLLVNALSDPQSSDPAAALHRVYDPGRPIGWLSVAATGGAVLGVVAQRPLARLAQQGSYAIRMVDHFSRMIDPEIRDLARGRVAWGTAVVIQGCPLLEEGWRNEQMTLHLEPHSYRLPEGERAAFAHWEASLPADSSLRRGTAYRLTTAPLAFTDDPDLRLSLQENRFVEVQYYRRVKAVDRRLAVAEVVSVLAGDIDFPHSFCLHAVVATSDGWVLLTRRSRAVIYHPDTWSVSLEEQFHRHDLRTAGEQAVQGWAERMLREELGVPASTAADSQVRAFAVFLEADILNCSLVALVTLSVTRQQLDALIAGHPRADYEFQDWTFLQWSDIVRELVTPTRTYHPTAGLRMLLAGGSKFGYYTFAARMDKLFLSNP